MNAGERLRHQIDAASLVDQLGDLIWDPEIPIEKMDRVVHLLQATVDELAEDAASAHGAGSKLPARTRQTLAFVRSYHEAFGYAPSIRDIQEAIGAVSPSTAAYHVKRLEEEGFLISQPGIPRSLIVVK